MKKEINIKPFQEQLNMGYCSPASLQMALDYYGIEKIEDELAPLIGWDKDLGADDQGIKKAEIKLFVAETVSEKNNIIKNNCHLCIDAIKDSIELYFDDKNK